MKKKILDYAFLLGIAGVVVAFDQITKSLVRNNLPLGSFWSPWDWLTPYARIVHWQNTGAAFGLFQNFSGVFAVLAVLVSIAILYYYPQVPRSDRVIRLAMGMQLGGALGNLIDRLLQQGNVTDFVSVGNFAVFNVADASISVGVVVLILAMWIKEQKEPAQSPAEPNPDSEPEAPELESTPGPLPEEAKGE